MGEKGPNSPGLLFDRRVKLEFHGAKVTSDAGLLAVRELDDAFGFTEKAGRWLRDPRVGQNKRHSLTALLRQSIYSRLAGYEDLNDAERLAVDPAMRTVVGGRAKDKEAASSSEMGRFETKMLTEQGNLECLMSLPGTWVDAVQKKVARHHVVLDMDSSVSETYGNQEGSEYNGHFEHTCYHPLFLFNQDGDLERALLRPGNVHSADDWQSVLDPVISRYRRRGVKRIFFRADAAFAKPEIYRYLEQGSIRYGIRIPSNKVLQRKITHLLQRPRRFKRGKPVVRYASFEYRADTWSKSRRVVAKVEWHPDRLLPQIGFIVTNLGSTASRVTRFYNGRGRAEQCIKEGKYALNWTRLSCREFEANQARLQLFALAYNLENFLRRLALPSEVCDWSLTTIKTKLIKIGAKIVVHSGYVTFQMAEVAIRRDLFAELLRRIHLVRWAQPVPT
jgi:hypothetical protein